MKEKRRRKNKPPAAGKKFDFLLGLIIIAYIFIPTFTPNLNTFDSNTSKFFATSLLNLLVLLVFIKKGFFRKNPTYLSRFFNTNTGAAYSLFLLFSLLSFIQSINIIESVVQFTKAFTLFAAVFNITVIFIHDHRFIKLIVLVITGMLIFDSVSVIYFIGKFIDGDIAQISDIKSVYSNKNILASAIFVKLPFALWLLVFEKGLQQKAGWLALTLGVTATLFMAARAFYIGLILLSIILIIYLLILYLRHRQKSFLWLTGSYLATLAIAFSAFSLTQQFLYPETGGRHTQDIASQVATVREGNIRVKYWNWSLKMLKEKPLLGIGTGNWKVNILEYENQDKPRFSYMIKAHNDFVEIATETGVLGGISYFAIFIFIIWNFLTYHIKRPEPSDNVLTLLFLAAAGILCYSIDAFFNFPADRPEIAILFSFFIAVGIAAVYLQHNTATTERSTITSSFSKNKWLLYSAGGIVLILLSVSSWILYLNFYSAKTQRIVFEEGHAGVFRSSSDDIIAGFPSVPNLSVVSQPVSTLKARYLIHEQKFEETIEVLRNDNSSPWDSRREAFMASAFARLNMPDSALHYSKKALKLKPNWFDNVKLTTQLLEMTGDIETASEYYRSYLENNNNLNAWRAAIDLHIRNDNLETADRLIDEAYLLHPDDTVIINARQFIYHQTNVKPHLPLYEEALEHFNANRHDRAVSLFSQVIDRVPDHFDSYQFRAFSYYNLEEFNKCIIDADSALEYDPGNVLLINLRGVCKMQSGDREGACDDFLKASGLGSSDGKANYQRHCQGN